MAAMFDADGSTHKEIHDKIMASLAIRVDQAVESLEV